MPNDQQHTTLIDGHGLVRAFGGRRAVNEVDITLQRGQKIAIVGPNGAGKSTLMRMLATLMRPDAGHLHILGASIPTQAMRARAGIGYLGHDPMVYLDLTARQNLELFADLYGIDDPQDRVVEVLSLVGLLARSHDCVRTFSRGMAQRLGLARLMLHRPQLVLLDEPSTGLDRSGRALLDALIAEIGPAQGMVMVTHEIDRAHASADEVLIMRTGRIVGQVSTRANSFGDLAAVHEELTR
jgi:heme exporter protein A